MRDGFFEKGSFGLSGLKREISELLSDTRETAVIDLPEFLVCLAFPRMSTVDIMCLAKYLPLFFWSRGLGSSYRPPTSQAFAILIKSIIFANQIVAIVTPTESPYRTVNLLIIRG